MSLLVNADAEFISISTGLPAGAGTIMAWMKPSTVSRDFNTFMGFDDTGSANGDITTGSGADADNIGIFTSGSFAAGPQITVDVWIHVCATNLGASSGVIELFIDGTSGLTKTSGAYTADRLAICNDQIDSSWRGTFCAVKIWDAVLTDAEIQQEMLYYLPVRLGDLYDYWPLLNERYVGFSNKNTWVETGTITVDADAPGIKWGRPAQILQFPPVAAPGGGRIMGSIAGQGGLAGMGGIAGPGGGLAG